MEESKLEEIINQTINGAILTIPNYLNEMEQNKNQLKIATPKEFVYGLIMGMSLGMASAYITTQEGMPTQEEQIKIRDLIYKKMPEIREKIFS